MTNPFKVGDVIEPLGEGRYGAQFYPSKGQRLTVVGIDGEWVVINHPVKAIKAKDYDYSPLQFEAAGFRLVSGYREHSQPKKESYGKTPLDLLFRFPGLKDVADIFGSSMEKYPDIDGDFNFRKGRGDVAYKMRLVGAGLRHVFAFMQGEKLDNESGKPHIAHAICNFMMVGDLDILESFKP